MKRYGFDDGYRYESIDGEYVLYEDHKEQIDAANSAVQTAEGIITKLEHRIEDLEYMLLERDAN